jgi:polysaccharide export outer membrane protein
MHHLSPEPFAPERSLLAIVVFLAACACGFLPAINAETPVVATTDPPSHFVIGPGDVLAINVFKEPEASVPSIVVRPDGFISMPMVKEVEAAGLTPVELEKVLSEKFARFLRDADVAVIVKEVHSEKVYVIGAVKKEGPITIRAPLTVLQAIAEAGGLTDYAKRGKLYILRRENGKEVQLPFQYSAVIRGDHSEQNIVLQPGDTVVVPQ